MLATTEREQSFFVGFRSMFFNVGKISAQGGLVFLAGELQNRTGSFAPPGQSVFALAAGIFLCLGIYHRFILPRPAIDRAGGEDLGRAIFQGLLLSRSARFSRSQKSSRCFCFSCFTGWARRNC